MSEQKKNKNNQKGPFEQAWYSHCPRHKDVYKMFFRPCPECIAEQELDDAILVLTEVLPNENPIEVEKRLNSRGFKIVRI